MKLNKKTLFLILIALVATCLLTAKKTEGLQVEVVSANMPDGIITLIDANDTSTSQISSKSAEFCNFKKEIKVGSETIKKCPVFEKPKDCLIKECTIM